MSTVSAAGHLRSEAMAASTSAHAERSERAAWSFPAARLILVSALCLAPLALGAVEPWAWPWLTVLALGALVAWGAKCWRMNEVSIYWSPLYGLGALLLAYGLVQYFGGLTLDRFETRNALIQLATDLLIFFLAGQIFSGESPKPYRQFGKTVLVYASGLALFGIFQAMTSHGLIYWALKPTTGNIFGPYVNRNDYAGLMEMLIPVAAAYVLTRRGGDSKQPLYAFGVAIAVASVFLSGSRGGMVSLLVEAVIFAGLAFRMRHLARWRKSLLAAALALAAGIGLSVWMNPAYLARRVGSLATLPESPEVTMGQRLVAGRDTMAMFRAHPLFGTGLGTFLAVFPQYETFATDYVWEHAHDDYAEALAEMGCVGGALLLGGIVVFLGTAFRNVKERLVSPAGWIQMGAALGCCGILVHSFVDFNLHIPANAAWFAACLGIATASPIRGGSARGATANAEPE